MLPEDAHQFYSKDVRSHGFARYREALAGSYNLSAVHTLQRVGVDTVLRKLRTAGLVDARPPRRGLRLGPRDRPRRDPAARSHRRVLDVRARQGGRSPRARSSWRPAPTARPGPSPSSSARACSPRRSPTCCSTSSAIPMRASRCSAIACRSHLPFPVALKTGTTKAYTDLWAIGVTREYTVGVWAGNFDGSPTHQVMSTEGATPLVRAAYTAIAARYGDPTAPDRPADGRDRRRSARSRASARGRTATHHKRELFVVGPGAGRDL